MFEDDLRIDEKTRKMVYFGDSRISQWKKIPEFAGIESVNCGVPGETTSQALLRIESVMKARRASFIVIQSGINDLKCIPWLSGREQEIEDQTVRQLEEIASIAANLSAEVILMTIIPPSDPDWLRRVMGFSVVLEAVKRVNSRLLQTRIPRVSVLDVAADLAPEGVLPADLSSDTLHFNDNGYQSLTTIVTKVIRGMIAPKGQ